MSPVGLALGATLLLMATQSFAGSLQCLDDLPESVWPGSTRASSPLPEIGADSARWRSALGPEAIARVHLPVRDPTSRSELGRDGRAPDGASPREPVRHDRHGDHVEAVRPDSPQGHEDVPPIPEPAGALAFGVGALLGGALAVGRRRAQPRGAR